MPRSLHVLPRNYCFRVHIVIFYDEILCARNDTFSITKPPEHIHGFTYHCKFSTTADISHNIFPYFDGYVLILAKP